MTTPATWEFEAIGTRWHIDTAQPVGDDARRRISGVIERFDQQWSRFRTDSLVTELGVAGGARPAPEDASALLDIYAQLSDATGGAVNPLVGGALARRGYDAGYGFVDHGPTPSPAPWHDLLTCADGHLTLAAPATIDIGAIGKGRLVDKVADVIGTTPVIVDAGGDIAVRGRTERIGLEHPFDTSRVIGVWEVTDAALCASAIGRRAWPGADGTGLHHVLDARTGQPVRAIAATWAVAPTAMGADAVATALFFEGGPALAHGWGVPWVRMTTAGAVEWSADCTAELYV